MQIKSVTPPTKEEAVFAEALHKATCESLSCEWDYDTWETWNRYYESERGIVLTKVRELMKFTDQETAIKIIKIWSGLGSL